MTQGTEAVRIRLPEIIELCSQLAGIADRIEILLDDRSVASVQRAVEAVERISEAKRMLLEVYHLKNLSPYRGPWPGMVRDLIERYRALEGRLKEIRNDLCGNRSRRAADHSTD